MGTKKVKRKRKLRSLTSIMPMLEWRPDISQLHMFRMPFNKTGGMKDLQLHTPIKSRKKYVWANVFQNLSYLPREIYMKDIQFGYIPKDHWRIVWVDTQMVVPIEDIKGLTLRGRAIQVNDWRNTYNPYVKFNKFVVDTLRHNRRVQVSLPSIVKTYKDNGIWEEIKQIKKDIWNITTSDHLLDLSYYFTWGRNSNGKQFIIPDPIKSLRIILDYDAKEPVFNFLLSNDTIQRHEMIKHIRKDLDIPHHNLPKSISQEQTYGYSEQGIDEEDDRLYDEWNSEQERQANMDSQDPF